MPSTYRVAVIGSTGQGNYGHGLDMVWKNLPQCEVVAVADDHPDGLANAKMRLGVQQGFESYHSMLEAVQPDLVSVAPRWTHQHRDMVIAAARAGVKGIYLEKPVCRSLEEADEMLEECRKSQTKVAVAHQTRYSPILKVVYGMIHDGTLGDLLEIHARGKEDHRGGGEDLWVLGTHVLNLMQFLGGGPQWCTSMILQQGQLAGPGDIHPGNEGLGPIAGDAIQAHFALESGAIGRWSSIRDAAAQPSRFGITLKGSRGLITMGTGFLPKAYWLANPSWNTGSNQRPWTPISSNGPGQLEPLEDGGLQAGNVLACQDLIAAIEDDRQPESNLADASLTTEMILGVFESHRTGKRISFPMSSRQHPLTRPFEWKGS